MMAIEILRFCIHNSITASLCFPAIIRNTDTKPIANPINNTPRTMKDIFSKKRAIATAAIFWRN